MRSLQPAVNTLEQVFETLMGMYQLDMKQRPVITIQSHGRRSALGWFWAKRWDNTLEKGIAEINISAEDLDRKDGVIATLIHELVHFVNNINGVKDCNSSQYHNKHFKAKAEQFGLVVEQMGRYGFAHTHMSEDLKKKVEALKIDYSAFALSRNELGKRQKAKTKMLKWSCGCTNVRCAVELNAECQECGERFNLVD